MKKWILFFLFTMQAQLVYAQVTILFKGVDKTTLDSFDDSIRFTVVASSLKGDLVGTVLVDPKTNGTYGAFAVAAEKGTYEMTIGRQSIEELRPVEPSAVGGEMRKFKAIVYDSNGLNTETEFAVWMQDRKWSDIADDLVPQELYETANWKHYYDRKEIFFGYSGTYYRVSYDRITDMTSLATHALQSYNFKGYKAFSDIKNLCSQTSIASITWVTIGAEDFQCQIKGIRCISENNSKPNCWSVTN